MPAEFDIADQASKNLIAEVVKHIPPTKTGITISATDSCFRDILLRVQLCLVRVAALHYWREGRLLFSFNDGDLVGVERLFQKGLGIDQSGIGWKI